MRRGLLATRDELTGLREKLSRRPFDTIYQALHRRCELILETAPVNETRWRTSWAQGYWCSAVLAARTTQGRIMDLAVAHHIDPNPAFRDRAIEELKNLAAWSTWVDPCHNDLPADLCTAEAAVAAAVGLDWLWEDLSPADRKHITQAIIDKAIVPYRQAVEADAWWYTCYHNWNAVVNGGCALAALALSDEDDRAEAAYRKAARGLKHFFRALGKDGDWDEGVTYWGYAMRYVLLAGEASARLLDDQRILHNRGMAATGAFCVYFTPNGHAAPIGDSSRMPLFGALYLLVKHFDAAELLWWLDTYSFHNDVSADGYSAAALAMLFRPADATTPTDPPLEPLKVYAETGVAAMADRWPRPTLYAAVRSGDLSANHSHHDMNSLEVQVDGEMLLTDPGRTPYTPEHFSTARGTFYHVQARAHNTVTVGQRDHQLDAQGNIMAARAGKDYRWMACDGRAACGDNVHFHRHVVMLLDADGNGTALVVLDDIHNTAPEDVELFWHARGPVDLDPDLARGTIAGGRTTLHFALACDRSFGTRARKRSINHHTVEYVLCAQTPRALSVRFVSAFARGKIGGQVEVSEDEKGRVTVTTAGAVLHFKPARAGLRLDKIDRA